MQRDLAKLSRFIQVPNGVLDASWETETLGKPDGLGPTDWVLIAVLRFEPGALQSIVSSSPKMGEGAAPTIDHSLMFDWYPDTVRSHLKTIGEKTLRFDRPAYQPDLFIRSPLLNGYFVPVSKEDVFLFLQTS